MTEAPSSLENSIQNLEMLLISEGVKRDNVNWIIDWIRKQKSPERSRGLIGVATAFVKNKNVEPALEILEFVESSTEREYALHTSRKYSLYGEIAEILAWRGEIDKAERIIDKISPSEEVVEDSEEDVERSLACVRVAPAIGKHQSVPEAERYIEEMISLSADKFLAYGLLALIVAENKGFQSGMKYIEEKLKGDKDGYWKRVAYDKLFFRALSGKLVYLRKNEELSFDDLKKYFLKLDPSSQGYILTKIIERTERMKEELASKIERLIESANIQIRLKNLCRLELGSKIE